MPCAFHPVVIRFGRLGDTVLLQPLLHRLQQHYGQPCDLLASGPWPTPLYAHQPDVAEVRVLQAPHRPLWLSRECRHVVDWLRERREAPVYVCEPRANALRRIRHMLHQAGVRPAHLAAAMGGPLVVMFGHASPAHWAPRAIPGGVVTVLGGRAPDARVDDLRVQPVVEAWCALRPQCTGTRAFA